MNVTVIRVNNAGPSGTIRRFRDEIKGRGHEYNEMKDGASAVHRGRFRVLTETLYCN